MLLRNFAEYENWCRKRYCCDIMGDNEFKDFLDECNPGVYPCIVLETCEEKYGGAEGVIYITMKDVNEWYRQLS